MCALRRCYSAPCRWYANGPVGRIRYYFVPPSNAWLYTPTAFATIIDENSENPKSDTGKTGEVCGSKRRYDRGTNFRPDLDGSHPLGTAADFAGQTQCPAVQPPEPDCAVVSNPQMTLLLYGTVGTSAGGVALPQMAMQLEYFAGRVLPGVAGDVWRCPAVLTYRRPFFLAGQAGDKWGARGVTNYFVVPHYLLPGTAGDLWGCHGKTHYFVAPDYSIPGTAGDLWGVKGKGVYVPHFVHTGTAGDKWGVTSTLTYHVAYSFTGTAGDKWGVTSTLTYNAAPHYAFTGTAGDKWGVTSTLTYAPVAYSFTGTAGDKWGVTSTLTYAVVYVSDTFSGSSGTALGGHTAGTGQVWTDTNAGMQLDGSGKVGNLPAAINALSYLDVGHSDFTLNVNWTYNAVGSTNWVYFRFSSVSSTWGLSIIPASGMQLTVTGSSPVTYAHAFTLGQTYAIKIVAAGTTVQVYVDGVLHLTKTFSTAINSNTKIALSQATWSTGSASKYDTLLVTP